MPSGSSRHRLTSTQRYCAYMAPPAAATVLPSRACAAGDEPAATTGPAPSLPTGIEMPTRPATARMAASGSGAVTTGLSGGPLATAAATSAPASSNPRSEGLMGVASTRTSTSVGPGSGTSTVSRDSWIVWSAVTSDRSCSAVAGMCADMGAAPLDVPWRDPNRPGCENSKIAVVRRASDDHDDGATGTCPRPRRSHTPSSPSCRAGGRRPAAASDRPDRPAQRRSACLRQRCRVAAARQDSARRPVSPGARKCRPRLSSATPVRCGGAAGPDRVRTPRCCQGWRRAPWADGAPPAVIALRTAPGRPRSQAG